MFWNCIYIYFFPFLLRRKSTHEKWLLSLLLYFETQSFCWTRFLQPPHGKGCIHATSWADVCLHILHVRSMFMGKFCVGLSFSQPTEGIQHSDQPAITHPLDILQQPVCCRLVLSCICGIYQKPPLIFQLLRCWNTTLQLILPDRPSQRTLQSPLFSERLCCSPLGRQPNDTQCKWSTWAAFCFPSFNLIPHSLTFTLPWVSTPNGTLIHSEV